MMNRTITSHNEKIDFSFTIEQRSTLSPDEVNYIGIFSFPAEAEDTRQEIILEDVAAGVASLYKYSVTVVTCTINSAINQTIKVEYRPIDYSPLK